MAAFVVRRPMAAFAVRCPMAAFAVRFPMAAFAVALPMAAFAVRFPMAAFAVRCPLAAFAISGAFHEYAFALQQPALRQSAGRCALFFLLQAPLVSAETLVRARMAPPWPMSRSGLACTACWTLAIVPLAPLFMHPLKTSGVFEQIRTLVPRLHFVE